MAEVPMPDWAPADGPWCLKKWLPSSGGKYVFCLLAPKHDGECRDQFGAYHSRSTSLFLGDTEVKSLMADNDTSGRSRVIANHQRSTTPEFDPSEWSDTIKQFGHWPVIAAKLAYLVVKQDNPDAPEAELERLAAEFLAAVIEREGK